MPAIIEAEHLSKRYQLGEGLKRSDNLREALARKLKAPLRAFRRQLPDRPHGDCFFALRDVNFQISAGESVGFIGANGAGKSTLFKILSRVTDPTEGRARLRGRVASLLEVGTGFHPELTGRENIFLNGAMLGMRRAEIRLKFDEIVSFAELEMFLDTPVKHYSSGMYVRLGFAVAAHLDPEILVVDEVLAVGDMSFQRKCLGKMGEFGRGGRTVLFVSHNLAAVENLCQRAIVLQKGQVVFDGSTKGALTYYVRSLSNTGVSTQAHAADLATARRPAHLSGRQLRRLEVYVGNESFNGYLPIGGSLSFHVHFHLDRMTEDFDPRINFMDLYGNVIFAARCSFESNRSWGARSGMQEFICDIPRLLLTPGEYRIEVGLVLENKVADYTEDVLRVTVLESDYYGTGAVPKTGHCVMAHHWRPA